MKLVLYTCLYGWKWGDSLVPSPYEGEERAWYTLLAHAPGAPEKCGAPDTIVYLVYNAYSVYALC